MQRPQQSNSSLSEQVTGKTPFLSVIFMAVKTLNCSKMIFKVPEWFLSPSVLFSLFVRETMLDL